MKVTEALEDIAYIKSLCQKTRGDLYSWRPFFLVFSVLWMVGMIVPLIPGVTTRFSLDGKHWPILFLIGIMAMWITKKKTKIQQIPFMMRLLLWNWAMLFVFALAALFWSPVGHSTVHMYNYWLMVIGVAFFMTGVTLLTRIGWIGFGFFGVALTPTDFILGKAITCGLLLVITWWLMSRSKAGAIVE